MGMILRVNSEGSITEVIGCNDGSISSVSHVEEVKYKGTNVIYLGSVQRTYIGKLSLK